MVLLFLLGVAYGFFFAAPRALQFLSSFMSDMYEWSPEGSEVISFFLMLMLGPGSGLPAAGGDVHPGQAGGRQPAEDALVSQVRGAGLLILAAVITPSTDPFNMVVVAVPLYLLYEIGILVATVFARTPLNASAAA